MHTQVLCAAQTREATCGQGQVPTSNPRVRRIAFKNGAPFRTKNRRLPAVIKSAADLDSPLTGGGSVQLLHRPALRPDARI